MRIPYFVACGVLSAAISTNASAQIGGLLRRAKDAAANKVIENKNLKPSSAFGAELTEASLDGVIRGLAAAQARLNEAEQVRTERQRLDAEWSRSSQAHEKDREAYDALRRKIEPCQDSVVHTRGKEAQAAYMAKMQSNPAAQAQMMQAAMQLAQKSAALQAKGDTAEIRRLNMELARSQGIDPRADSAVAIKVCGPIPATPAWLAEQDSLRARSTRLDGQVREIENGAQGAAVAASGMSIKEYALARERVLNWYQEAHGGSPVQAFGSDERKLMEARRSEIEKYRNALT